MSCQSRIIWWQRIRLMELDTDQLKGNWYITKPTKHSGRQTRRVTKPCWPDSQTIQFKKNTNKNWMGWEHMYCVRRDLKRGPFLRCDNMRTEQKRKLVEARVELWGCKWTRESARYYKEAKKTCNTPYREFAATAGCGDTRIHRQEQVRQRPTIWRTWRGFLSNWFRNWMDILNSRNNHNEFFFIILVATIRQLVDSMELGLFIMEWAIDFLSSRC